MSEYDPFNLPEPTAEERRQKHFLDFNGLWLNSNDSSLNDRCLCGCFARDHLDGTSICLRPQCICDRFVPKTYRVITTTTKNKEQKEHREELVVQDGKIAQVNKDPLFLRQYGL
jgi:hypothetical protein